MIDLIAIAFDNEFGVFSMRDELAQLQQKEGITPTGAVIIERDEKGKLEQKETTILVTKKLIQEVGEMIGPGQAVLLLPVYEYTMEKVQPLLEKYNATVIDTIALGGEEMPATEIMINGMFSFTGAGIGGDKTANDDIVAGAKGVASGDEDFDGW